MKPIRKAVAIALAVLLIAAVLPMAFADDLMPRSGVITDPGAAGGNPENPDGGESGEVTPEPEPTAPPVQETAPPATEAPAPPPTQAPATPAPEYSYVAPRIDYTGLSRQIAIANGLSEKEYTAESWQKMQEALQTANNTLNSSRQYAVDNAKNALETALAELVKMDYTALKSVLAEIGELNEPDGMYDVWVKLIDATERAKAQIGSGDQAAVNAAARELNTIMTELKVCMEALGNPEVVIQEVEVEVPPTSDFCNIPMHRVWPVLFFCSLAVNVGLAVLIVFILRKKKNQTDDTPLVDYDIGLDDELLDDEMI